MNAPCPRSREVPVLGATPWLIHDPLSFLIAEHQRLGSIFRVRTPGRSITVLAGRDANAWASGAGRDVLLAAPFWHQLTVPGYDSKNMILGVDGPTHRGMRRGMRSALSRVSVEAHDESLAALMNDVLAPLEASGDEASAVGLTHYTRLAVSRLIHHLMTGGEDEPVAEDLARDMMERFRWETNARLLGKWPTALLRAPSHRRRVERVNAFGDELIARAKSGARSEWARIGARLQDFFPDPISDGDLRLHFLFPYVAGVDTVAVTLAFLLYEVSRRPEWALRVRQEVRDACGESLSESEMRKLPFLNALINEALRRYPAAFGMYRRAGADFEFEGVRVPEGAAVLLLTAAGHFDPRYYEDPTSFDPTRHLAPRAEPSEKHVFMPYGAGPHVCLGAGMGEAILRRLVAEILCRYDLELAAAPRVGAPVHTFDPSLSLRHDVRVRVRRNPDEPPRRAARRAEAAREAR